MSEITPIDVTAPSVEEAIQAGLLQLGLSRNDVIVEIVDEGSAGVFGVGARDANVRLTPLRAPTRREAPPEPEPEPEMEPEPEPQPAPEAETEAAGPKLGEGRRERRARRPRLERRARRAGRQPRPSYNDTSVAEVDVTDTAPVEAEPEPEPLPEEAQPAPAPDLSPPAGPTGVVEDEALIARQTVREILRHMGINANVDVSPSQEPDGPWLIDVTGADLGALIGKRGETLDALQYLTRQIASRSLQRRVDIVVDVEGYKARRANSLEKLARRMANKAASMGRTVTLEPMPPNERRIIHVALRNNSEVTTESIGSGDRRRVTIIPTQN